MPGPHCDPAAMVGDAGDQVADKSSDIGTKASDTASSFPGSAYEDTEGQSAGFEGVKGLLCSHSRAIQLGRDRFGFGGLQPHHADVVQVGDDGGNGAALAFWRFRLPCRIWKIFDQIAVDSVVRVESVLQPKRYLLYISLLNGYGFRTGPASAWLDCKQLGKKFNLA